MIHIPSIFSSILVLQFCKNHAGGQIQTRPKLLHTGRLSRSGQWVVEPGGFDLLVLEVSGLLFGREVAKGFLRVGAGEGVHLGRLLRCELQVAEAGALKLFFLIGF